MCIGFFLLCLQAEALHSSCTAFLTAWICNVSKCLMWLEMCRPHKVPWDLSAKDHRPQCYCCYHSPVNATGRAVEPTPSPLILWSSKPVSLCILTSVNTRRRGDASYTQEYVSGYWVMLCCNVDGNRAHRDGEKETASLILFNPP